MLWVVADALIDFAHDIASKTGRGVPTPNPDGPTTRALALFVLRDPGVDAESGANKTGLLDPYTNDDRTSLSQRKHLSAAKIDPGVGVWWNASPYHLGYKVEINEADCAAGARYLLGFVARCPDLRVVVAMGRDSRTVCARAWRDAEQELPRLILTHHPLIYGRDDKKRLAELGEALREVARLIGS